MKSYPEYKESSIEWLDKIPISWNEIAIKHLASLKSGENITSQEIDQDGQYAVYGGNGIRGFYSEYTHDGNFVLIGRQGALCGNINYAKGKFWATEHAVVATPKREYKLVWFGELLRTMNLNQYSMSAAQPGLSVERIENLKIPIPPLPEQHAIADFLNCKTAQIDTLIEKKQRQIDLLQEQRTALINHAVTKGLNPDAPMNDSGVEWYGEIPEHWEMKRLGRITSVIMDIDHKMPLAIEDGYPFLSAKDLLNDGTLNFDNDVKKISDEDFQKLSRKVQPKRNDIIYSRIGARLGKARLVETDRKFIVSYSCCVVRVIEELALPEYICIVMDSEILLTEAKARTVGIGVPDLGLGEIAKFPIPLPPKTEQAAILEFLKQKDSKIKAGIRDISKQIALLNEYRTALISEAVTGKIDVR